MLLTIAIILLILWALGFFAFHITSGLIHIILVIGIIVLIWNFVAGRGPFSPETLAVAGRRSAPKCGQ